MLGLPSPTRASREAAPGPVKASVAAAMAMTNGYPKPLFAAHRPLRQRMATALSMAPMTTAAANGVMNPAARAAPPTISAVIAKLVTNFGGQ